MSDNSNNYLYNYSLTFDSPVTYDSVEDDLVGSVIQIQGEKYTLMSVGLSDDDTISEISLLPGIAEYTDICDYSIGGSVTSSDSSSITINELNIDFNSEDSEPAGELEINIEFTALQDLEELEIEVELTGLEEGTVRDTEYVDEVLEGESYTEEFMLTFPWDMSLEEEYTLEISICPRSGDCATGTYDFNVEVEESDTCELGTDLIKLIHKEEMQSINEDIDGTLSLIDSTPGEWSGFSIVYAPDTDEIYLEEERGVLYDPIFQSFKLNFDEIENNNDYEEIEFVSGSTSGEIRFLNRDETYVEIPLAADSSATSGEASDEPIYWGQDAPTSTAWNQDELVYLEGETCYGTSSVVDCQGAMFLVVENNNVHLLQITNIDTNNNHINLDDLTYNTVDDDMSYTDGSVSDITLTSAGTIQLLVDESATDLTFTTIGSSDGAKIITYDFSVLEIVNTDISTQTFEGLKFSEYNDGAIDTYLEDFEINAVYDDVTDNTIEWDHHSITSLTSSDGYGLFDYSDENDDDVLFMTFKGTLLRYDREDMQSFEIRHPEQTLYAVLILENLGEVSSEDIEELNTWVSDIRNDMDDLEDYISELFYDLESTGVDESDEDYQNIYAEIEDLLDYVQETNSDYETELNKIKDDLTDVDNEYDLAVVESELYDLADEIYNYIDDDVDEQIDDIQDEIDDLS